MTILVTGSRDWWDTNFIWEVLDRFAEKHGKHNLLIVQGMAKGADIAARNWAQAKKVDHACFYAHWDVHGKAAGPKRNAFQADKMCPDLCLAFHPSIANAKGTKSQVAYIRTFHKDCEILVLTGEEKVCDLSLP
jgi:hypothetical protein